MKASQVIIATVTLIIVGIVLGGVFFYITFRADSSSIDYMLSLQRGPYNFSDTAGDIGAEGPEDIGWEPKSNGDIILHYGKQIVVINEAAKKDQVFMNKLGRLGVEITELPSEDKKASPNYKVVVWGTEIEPWALVN